MVKVQFYKYLVSFNNVALSILMNIHFILGCFLRQVFSHAKSLTWTETGNMIEAGEGSYMDRFYAGARERASSSGSSVEKWPSIKSLPSLEADCWNPDAQREVATVRDQRWSPDVPWSSEMRNSWNPDAPAQRLECIPEDDKLQI